MLGKGKEKGYGLCWQNLMNCVYFIPKLGGYADRLYLGQEGMEICQLIKNLTCSQKRERRRGSEKFLPDLNLG